MDCADYRLYRNGDSDGDGNDLMHGVLDGKSVLEFDFQNALLLEDRINILLMHMVFYYVSDAFHRLHSLTLPLTERVRSFHSAVS